MNAPCPQTGNRTTPHALDRQTSWSPPSVLPWCTTPDTACSTRVNAEHRLPKPKTSLLEALGRVARAWVMVCYSPFRPRNLSAPGADSETPLERRHHNILWSGSEDADVELLPPQNQSLCVPAAQNTTCPCGPSPCLAAKPPGCASIPTSGIRSRQSGRSARAVTSARSTPKASGTPAGITGDDQPGNEPGLGGHLIGRFRRRLPSPPAWWPHGDSGGLQTSGRGFPLDAPQRPAQPPQGDDLLPLLFAQDIAHFDGG